MKNAPPQDLRAAVKIKGEVIDIPRRFWRENTGDYLNGRLNRKQCARLYKMLGRTDAPPKSLTVYVNKDDLLEMAPYSIRLLTSVQGE